MPGRRWRPRRPGWRRSTPAATRQPPNRHHAETVGHQFPDHAPAGRAERQPHANLGPPRRDGEGDDRVDAAGGEGQQQRAEHEEEPGGNALQEQVVLDVLVERADVEDRRRRIEAAEGGPYRAAQRRLGARTGAHVQLAAAAGPVAIGEVDGRRRRFAERVGQRGRDHAADRVAAVALLELTADDRAVGQVAIDEGLVHHHLRRGRAIAERHEAVAADPAYAHHLEVPRGDDVRRRPVDHAVGARPSFEPEGAPGQAVDVERHRRGAGDADHAGQRPQPVEHALEEGHGRRVVIAASAAIVSGQQHALAIEPGVGIAGVGERAEEQSGDDQHDHGERDLGGHRRRAPPAWRRRPRPGGDAGRDVEPEHLERRQQADQDRAGQAEPERHRQASRIHRGLEADRQAGGERHCSQRGDTPTGQHRAKGGAEAADHEGLSQEQPRNPPRRGADRQADGQFALS